MVYNKIFLQKNPSLRLLKQRHRDGCVCIRGSTLLAYDKSKPLFLIQYLRSRGANNMDVSSFHRPRLAVLSQQISSVIAMLNSTKFFITLQQI